LTINMNYAILSYNERAEGYSGPYRYETEPVRGLSLQHEPSPTGRLFYKQKKRIGRLKNEE